MVTARKSVPLARPYWWDDVPTLAATSWDDAPLPTTADTVVIGGGLTGTSAAYELASASRRVLVLDAAVAGSGASSRNAGMVGRYLKFSFGELMVTRGLDAAKLIFGEMRRVYEECIDRIQGEGMACGLRMRGRVVGAVSPAHRERLYREWDLRGRHLGEAFRRLDAPTSEIVSRYYHGGIHILDNAALQPALYTDAMRRRAEAAGATVRSGCAVTGYVREADNRFHVATERGNVVARNLIVATNGLTDARLPAFADRLAPINALMPGNGRALPGFARRRNQPCLDGTLRRFRGSPSALRHSRRRAFRPRLLLLGPRHGALSRAARRTPPSGDR